MELRISISKRTELQLREQAEAAGIDWEGYVSRLVDEVVAQRAVDRSLDPLRRQFKDSRTSEEQLIEQITQAQQAYRAERRSKA